MKVRLRGPEEHHACAGHALQRLLRVRGQHVAVVRARREPAGELEEIAQVVVRRLQFFVRLPDLFDRLPGPVHVLADGEHHHRRRHREGEHAGDPDLLVGDRQRNRDAVQN